MKKTIFLFFAAILCAMTANAATVTSDGTARLYFNMKAVSWWTAGNNGDGNFGYFFNNSTGKNAWSAHAVKHSGDTYYVVIPNGTWAGVILTRNNTSTAPSWDNKWNQTGDIILSSTSNYISKFTDNSASVTWGTPVKPASNAAVSAASTIFVGASTTLTPSLTSNADINDIKSTTYTISPTTGASISGNTFTASAEGTYTITATVTYHPDGYSDTKLQSTATATTTIVAEIPAEETHDVTVSYICGETKLQDPTTVNTVGVETSVKVTAPEIAKYTFANWTLGADVATSDALTATSINITTKAGGSDFTLVANYEKFKLTYTVTVPAGTENCYLVGKMNEWDVDNPIEMANQGNNVFKVVLEDVTTDMQYKYISKKGTWDYEEVGGNRTWTANDVVTAWKDPLITNVYLYGAMNGWKDTNPFKKETKEASTASVTVTLEAGTDYEFKIVDDGKWKSNATAITGTITGWTFTEGGGNAKLTTVAAGDYVFTWEMSTSKLSIAYPEVPTPEYKDITIQVYAKEVPNIWWWNGGDQCPSTEDLVNPATGNKYQWAEAPAMEKVAGEDNWYTKTFAQVDITRGGIKFKLQSTDHNASTTSEVVTTEDKCYDARVIATVTETTCGELPSGEIPTVTYNVTVPTGTPACYIAGEMTGWSHQAMTKVDETHYTITIEGAQKTHEYKYSASNNWDLVELNEEGKEKTNRTWSDNDVVAQWATPAAPVPTTYTVAGNNTAAFGTEWDPTNAANDMVLEGGLYKWTKTNVALSANTEIKFQVVKNHDWNAGQWPGRDNDWVLNTITEDGLYTITITFKEDDKKINATATKTGEVVTKDFSNQPATLYFHPSFHWTSDNAQFAAYFYNNGPGADAEPTWKSMTAGANGVYEVPNAKEHEYVIFCRMNPERAENNWDNNVMWNQIETGITIPNAAGDLNTCLAFWTNCQGKVPTSECTWVAPTPLTDKNWDAFIAAYNGKTINAVVERSFTSGQNHTLCLPFDLPTNWLGEGAKAYQLSSIVENADELKLTVTTHTTLSAGKPYIIVPVKGEEYEHLIVSGVTVKNATAATNSAVGANYQATLKAVTATNGTTNGSTEYYVGANDGCLYNAVVDKLGLRAVIELTTTGGQPLPAKVRAYVATGENEATGFENIVAPEGQTIKAIVNGQLVIIRGGEMYNVQGQVIR